MRKLSLVSVMGLVCLIATSAGAQVEKGDVELDFSGSLVWREASANGYPEQQSLGISISAGAGFFLTPHVDVGGEIGASYFDYDEGGDRYDLWLRPGFRYHFRPETKIVPFAGGGFGVIRDKSDYEVGDSTQDGWSADASGGADFFLNDFVSIKLTLRYRHVDLESKSKTVLGETEQSAESDEVMTFVGLSFFLSRK